MSIATMNWALQQRLASPQQQILLYVIADSASPDGMTQHCDPDYLVRHSRLSRATVFRRLAELRELGLLETFNKHGARGMRIYEIRLALTAVVQLPLKGEHDDGTGDDAEDESQRETQGESHAETRTVSPVRPAQSHSCDSISPPLSKDSPPNPPPGGSGSINSVSEDPKHWPEFRKGYPETAVWTCWDKALALFRLLSDAERELALAALPLWHAQITRMKQKPLRPDRFLRERMFDHYPNAKLPEKPPEPVWIDDPGELAALRVMRRIADLPPLREVERDGKSSVQRFASVGADLRGLAAFDRTDELGWIVVEPGTPEFNAWRHRLHDWTGQWLEARVVMREGTSLIELPGRSPMQAQNRTKGLPVPCRWPPRKDGSIGAREGDSEG